MSLPIRVRSAPREIEGKRETVVARDSIVTFAVGPPNRPVFVQKHGLQRKP